MTAERTSARPGLRLNKTTLALWGGLAVAASLASLALYLSPIAGIVWLAATGIAAWALRDARRTVSRAKAEEAIEFVGLAELAPLLEALPDPALLIDAQGRVVSSNAAARAQMRFQGRMPFLTAILRQPDVLEAVQAAVREGVTRAVEYEQPTQAERHTRCYVAPMTWGAERAAMLVFHDQTARIRSERMRADFLANASHELRTPLASLTLLIETLVGPARENADDRDRFLRMMQTQADRMRRLIEDLLSLSRIEMDEHVPPSDRADLVVVAREAADALFAVSRERGVELKVVTPDKPVRVVGERFQLAQVVQNLIDNAIKYSNVGGVVHIEVAVAANREDAAQKAGRRWDESGRLALLTPAPTASRYAYVRVEDAGPGIAKRYLPRLGERFFRVEREMGDERGGTGLGLAIVKHIVNRHRGGLVVESLPGRGSAFAAFIELAD
jgi:two-component system phosphate regulon sensor histidine kinase PhoR